MTSYRATNSSSVVLGNCAVVTASQALNLYNFADTKSVIKGIGLLRRSLIWAATLPYISIGSPNFTQVCLSHINKRGRQGVNYHNRCSLNASFVSQNRQGRKINENARKFLKHAYLLFPNPFFLEIPKSILSIKENLVQILNHFTIGESNFHKYPSTFSLNNSLKGHKKMKKLCKPWNSCTSL